MTPVSEAKSVVEATIELLRTFFIRATVELAWISAAPKARAFLWSDAAWFSFAIFVETNLRSDAVNIDEAAAERKGRLWFANVA